MKLDIELSEQGAGLKHLSQAFQAWTNGLRAIEGADLPELEKASRGSTNNKALQIFVAEGLISFEWSARSVRNVIEERYPALSIDEVQLHTRRLLMRILNGAMDDVEAHRKETCTLHKGAVLF